MRGRHSTSGRTGGRVSSCGRGGAEQLGIGRALDTDWWRQEEALGLEAALLAAVQGEQAGPRAAIRAVASETERPWLS